MIQFARASFGTRSTSCAAASTLRRDSAQPSDCAASSCIESSSMSLSQSSAAVGDSDATLRATSPRTSERIRPAASSATATSPSTDSSARSRPAPCPWPARAAPDSPPPVQSAAPGRDRTSPSRRASTTRDNAAASRPAAKPRRALRWASARRTRPTRDMHNVPAPDATGFRPSVPPRSDCRATTASRSAR